MRSNVQQLSREMAPLAIPHIHVRAPCTTTTTTTIGVEICPPARSPAAKGGRARRRLVRGNSKGDGGNFTAARIARCILKSTAVPHPDPGTRALPRRTTTAPESCSRIRLRRLLPTGEVLLPLAPLKILHRCIRATLTNVDSVCVGDLSDGEEK